MGRNLEHDGEVQIDMSKKFDIAIMNPPYDRNLHLKILEKVIPVAEETINISPIRWLQDPLAKYKKNSDYNKFKESIAEHIIKADEITTQDAGDLFSIGATMQLGIMHLSNSKTGYTPKDDNKLIHKIIEQLPTERIECKYSEPVKYSLVVSMISGGNGGRTESISHWLSPKDKVYYDNGKNSKGETYYEYRKRVCWGNNKPKSEITHFEFDNKEERDNFYDSCETTFFRYCFKSLLRDVHVPYDFIPIMFDYTHPWDNKRFCDYFNITGYIDDEHAEPDSEWEEILSSMSKYK